jgi:hypothetical protein
VSWWKILGLAGVAGVAATGVVIARSERARRAYTPDEIREQLHTRLATAGDAGPGDATGPGLPPAARHPARVDGSAQRAAGPAAVAAATSPAAVAAAAGRRLSGWRHGLRRPPRHHPRLRPHRR